MDWVFYAAATKMFLPREVIATSSKVLNSVTQVVMHFHSSNNFKATRNKSKRVGENNEEKNRTQRSLVEKRRARTNILVQIFIQYFRKDIYQFIPVVYKSHD